VTGDANAKEGVVARPASPARERVAERIRRLDAIHEQFHEAEPDLSLQRAAREPSLRLSQILEMFVEGYADRPALGSAARSLSTDAATGRTAAGGGAWTAQRGSGWPKPWI
jgi:fatty acid CoA ligase FadD9